jgi:hypothetical protein
VRAVEQFGFALVPVLGGVVLLLLAGTQIVQWYWLVLLSAAGLTIAAVRIRARNRSRYEVAQMLDKRLDLGDAVSTAWFVIDKQQLTTTRIGKLQIQHAEERAAGIRTTQAFPLTWNRGWSVTAAMATLAFGLFAARYLVMTTLDLQRPLIPFQIAPVFERLDARLATHIPLRLAHRESEASINKVDRNGRQLPDEKASEPSQGQRGNLLGSSNPDGKSASNALSEKISNTNDRDAQNGDSSNSRSGAPQANQASANDTNPQSADSKHQSTSGQQGAKGLMDKMKDALSSFLAKMREPGSRPNEQGNRTSEEDKTGERNSGKSKPGQQQDARNQQPNEDQSSEAQAQGQAAERTQAAQGRTSDSMPQNGTDAHSGVGRQDGDKGVKEAEQLRAMGKLAEIIGKRSASVTGDMTVETSSSNQQLKTAYSQKLGRHSDSGGEINRDEIPLADQQYVREYMELVRKQSKTAR